MCPRPGAATSKKECDVAVQYVYTTYITQAKVPGAVHEIVKIDYMCIIHNVLWKHVCVYSCLLFHTCVCVTVEAESSQLQRECVS